MIQSTAPTLATALSPSGSATAAAAAGDFAALLGGAGTIAVPTVRDASIDAATVAPAPLSPDATSLPDAVKGAREELAALAKQAGAATRPECRAATSSALQPTITGTENLANLMFSSTSQVALTVNPVTAPQPSFATDISPGAATAPASPVMPGGAGTAPEDTVPSGVADKHASTGMTVETATPIRAPSALPAAAAKPQPDGKNGKTDGKMLPQAASTRPDTDDVPDAPETAAVKPARPDPAEAVAEVVAVPVAASLAPPPAREPQAPSARRSAERDQPPASRSTTPAASPDVSPRVRAIRFEPIEIVRVPDATLKASVLAAASQKAVLPITTAPLRPPVATVEDPAAAGPVLAEPIQVAAQVEAAPNANPVPAPVPGRPVVTPVRPPFVQTAADDMAPAKDALDTIAAPVRPVSDTRVEAPAAPRRAAAPETPVSRPLRHELQATSPAPVLTQVAFPGLPAPDGSAPPIPTAPGETPHDFDTLVSRLSEAREAAAPHIVRTAFEHAEFGRVSMQLGHDEGGLSVTLSSRDADFGPAVQAAAAVASGGAGGSNTGNTPDQPRHDNPASPQQSQTSAQSQTSFNGGQGQQARTDGSGAQQQQQRRESGSSRQSEQPQPDAPQRPREDRRRGGVYA